MRSADLLRCHCSYYMTRLPAYLSHLEADNRAGTSGDLFNADLTRVQSGEGVSSRHGIAYTEHNVAEDTDALQRLRQLTGRNIVPTLLIGGKVFIGFADNRQEIERLLGLAGAK